MSKITAKKRLSVYDKFKGKCAYCGCNILLSKFHIDHIEPKHRGYSQHQLNSWGSKIIKGTDHIDNLNPACISCNLSKSTFSIEDWRKEIELKKDRIKKDSTNFNILLRFGLIKEITIPVIFHFETL